MSMGVSAGRWSPGTIGRSPETIDAGLSCPEFEEGSSTVYTTDSSDGDNRDDVNGDRQ